MSQPDPPPHDGETPRPEPTDEGAAPEDTSRPQPGFQAPDYQKEYEKPGDDRGDTAVYAAEQAYPPQQAYPDQQAYSDQQAYPQQQAYPRQQGQGYPQQGYPPQGSAPQPGYPVPVAYGPPGYPPVGPPPDNYLVWAILATVFCFWPTGIVAIVNAANVNGRWAMGDVQGALQASRSARKWSLWTALIAGGILAAVVVFYVLVALFVGGMALVGSSDGT